MFRWLDEKEAEYQYRQNQKSGGGLGRQQGTPGLGISAGPGRTFGTTVPGGPQPDRPAPPGWGT